MDNYSPFKIFYTSGVEQILIVTAMFCLGIKLAQVLVIVGLVWGLKSYLITSLV